MTDIITPEARAHAFLCCQYPGLSSAWTTDAHERLTQVIREVEHAALERAAEHLEGKAEEFRIHGTGTALVITATYWAAAMEVRSLKRPQAPGGIPMTEAAKTEAQRRSAERRATAALILSAISVAVAVAALGRSFGWW